jgi:DNA-binding response OmpR family regulator
MAEKRKRLLLVEDDPSVAKAVETTLQRYEKELEIISVSDAETAESSLQKGNWDLLVLDLMLPYGEPASDQLDPGEDPECYDTGLRILEWWREKEEGSGSTLPVMVITARSDPDSLGKLKLLLSGASGRLFLKPFDDILFEATVCKTLQIECRLPEFLLRSVRDGERHHD